MASHVRSLYSVRPPLHLQLQTMTQRHPTQMLPQKVQLLVAMQRCWRRSNDNKGSKSPVLMEMVRHDHELKALGWCRV